MNFLEEQEELEYDKKYQIKPVVKECIHELLERFWVLRDTDETLFYKIKDHEQELKKYFRETFRYRLISTHDTIKLEKVPVQTYTWMGEKNVNGSPTFKTHNDYAFFFWILAFLEGKSVDQQFTLQNICEFLEDKEEGQLVWKEGIGYPNRLSLVRVLKYAVKMNLIQVNDQEIDDFSANHRHDVLLERTPHSSYFMRVFQTDVTEWKNLSDLLSYVEKENTEVIERKHRYYRRLFLDPIVYHKEMTEEEQAYIKNYQISVENNIYRYTDYTYEAYNQSSLLVKSQTGVSEKTFPSENMLSKIVMLFASHLYQEAFLYPLDENRNIVLSRVEFDNVFSELKKSYRQHWTKKYKESKIGEIAKEALDEMKKWNFAEETEDGSCMIKEGIFRFIGDYGEK